MGRMQKFADKAIQLHKDLVKRSDDLPKGYFVPPSGRLTTAFRFVPSTPKFSSNGTIYDEISISTPMDSGGTIETALFKDDHMIDDDLLGYGDSIRRFDTVNDLIKELNRLDGTITESQEDKEDEEENEKSESEEKIFKEKFDLLFSFKKYQEAKNLEIQSLKEELNLEIQSLKEELKSIKKAFSIICSCTKEQLELLKKE